MKSHIKKIIDLHVQGQIPTEAFHEYHTEPYQQSLQLKETIQTLENEVLNDSVTQKSTQFIISESQKYMIIGIHTREITNGRL